jgi:hypothetical protein
MMERMQQLKSEQEQQQLESEQSRQLPLLQSYSYQKLLSRWAVVAVRHLATLSFEIVVC